MRSFLSLITLTWALSAVPGVAATAPTAPGDDFDAWANSPWLETTEIPAGRPRWNARDEIADSTRRQLSTLLDGAGAAPPGSVARKVADFRAADLNQAVIEQQGLAPLKPQLERIDAV